MRPSSWEDVARNRHVGAPCNLWHAGNAQTKRRPDTPETTPRALPASARPPCAARRPHSGKSQPYVRLNRPRKPFPAPSGHARPAVLPGRPPGYRERGVRTAGICHQRPASRARALPEPREAAIRRPRARRRSKPTYSRPSPLPRTSPPETGPEAPRPGWGCRAGRPARRLCAQEG